MTWHEKKNDDRRGDHVEEERQLDSWVYAGGGPVKGSRYDWRVKNVWGVWGAVVALCYAAARMGAREEERIAAVCGVLWHWRRGRAGDRERTRVRPAAVHRQQEHAPC